MGAILLGRPDSALQVPLCKSIKGQPTLCGCVDILSPFSGRQAFLAVRRVRSGDVPAVWLLRGKESVLFLGCSVYFLTFLASRLLSYFH